MGRAGDAQAVERLAGQQIRHGRRSWRRPGRARTRPSSWAASRCLRPKTRRAAGLAADQRGARTRRVGLGSAISLAVVAPLPAAVVDARAVAAVAVPGTVSEPRAVAIRGTETGVARADRGTFGCVADGCVVDCRRGTLRVQAHPLFQRFDPQPSSALILSKVQRHGASPATRFPRKGRVRLHGPVFRKPKPSTWPVVFPAAENIGTAIVHMSSERLAGRDPHWGRGDRRGACQATRRCGGTSSELVDLSA